MIRIHTDGGARGNPGPAAVGVVISWGKGNSHEISEYIGETTNNTAEYSALIKALKEILVLQKNGVLTDEDEIVCHLDSLLVVQQVRGVYKIKQPHLQHMASAVKTLEKEIRLPITYRAIPREQNQRADLLVNRALDTPHS